MENKIFLELAIFLILYRYSEKNSAIKSYEGCCKETTPIIFSIDRNVLLKDSNVSYRRILVLLLIVKSLFRRFVRYNNGINYKKIAFRHKNELKSYTSWQASTKYVFDPEYFFSKASVCSRYVLLTSIYYNLYAFYTDTVINEYIIVYGNRLR